MARDGPPHGVRVRRVRVRPGAARRRRRREPPERGRVDPAGLRVFSWPRHGGQPPPRNRGCGRQRPNIRRHGTREAARCLGASAAPRRLCARRAFCVPRQGSARRADSGSSRDLRAVYLRICMAIAALGWASPPRQTHRAGCPCCSARALVWQTALMWASACNHESIAYFLLQNGVDIEAKDAKSRTSVMLAAQNGQTVGLSACACVACCQHWRATRGPRPTRERKRAPGGGGGGSA